jgi:hypothetical protein
MPAPGDFPVSKMPSVSKGHFSNCCGKPHGAMFGGTPGKGVESGRDGEGRMRETGGTIRRERKHGTKTERKDKKRTRGQHRASHREDQAGAGSGTSAWSSCHSCWLPVSRSVKRMARERPLVTILGLAGTSKKHPLHLVPSSSLWARSQFLFLSLKNVCLAISFAWLRMKPIMESSSERRTPGKMTIVSRCCDSRAESLEEIRFKT